MVDRQLLSLHVSDVFLQDAHQRPQLSLQDRLMDTAGWYRSSSPTCLLRLGWLEEPPPSYLLVQDHGGVAAAEGGQQDSRRNLIGQIFSECSQTETQLLRRRGRREGQGLVRQARQKTHLGGGQRREREHNCKERQMDRLELWPRPL